MTSKQQILFEVKNLKKYYPVYRGFLKKHVNDVKALDDINLTVYKGETLGIVGESGCGKTTLGKTLMLLTKPTAGKIDYNFGTERKDITKLSRAELFNFRKQVQMVFQDPYSALNPVKKIYDAFDEPLLVHGYTNKKDRNNRINKAMSMVNLQSDYLYRYPHEFSGGQRQRLSIARVLGLNPKVIICDEPVSALDVSIQAQVLNLMKKIKEELDLTYIFIAHDLSVVQYMSDRIIVMYLGKIVEIASKEDLYRKPMHPYTEALLSAVPVPEIGKKKSRIILEGDVPSPTKRPSGCAFHTRCRHAMDICKTDEPRLEDKEKNHQVACHLFEAIKR
jgi:oligopeptide/dipeptide ABC transporter ATP-binding protein